MSNTPLLEGVHHLKLPVSDLDRSCAWYRDHLGYETKMRFVEGGVLMGVAMGHPNGGPPLALRVDPGRAAAAAGFDFFSIGVPGKDAIDALVTHLDEEGVPHDGVVRTPVGWVLSGIYDPDGYNVRFYTVPVELPPDVAEPIVRES
jgi:catechol 2,3-dioxygenase-like lactoylglutathione lyase family enzyme